MKDSINNIKHLELTRHHIFMKIRDYYEEKHKHDDNVINTNSELIFSSAFSLFVSILVETLIPETIKFGTIWTIIACFLLGVILYLGCFFITVKAYRKYKDWRDKHRDELFQADKSKQNIKLLIDDFDHIAFDNLLIAYDCQGNILPNNSKLINDYNFHELLYYLQSSSSLVRKVTNKTNASLCVHTYMNRDGKITLYRINNSLLMMEDLYQSVERILENKNEINGEKIMVELSDLSDEVKDDVKVIKENIESIRTRYNDLCAEFSQSRSKREKSYQQ